MADIADQFKLCNPGHNLIKNVGAKTCLQNANPMLIKTFKFIFSGKNSHSYQPWSIYFAPILSIRSKIKVYVPCPFSYLVSYAKFESD